MSITESFIVKMKNELIWKANEGFSLKVKFYSLHRVQLF